MKLQNRWYDTETDTTHIAITQDKPYLNMIPEVKGNHTNLTDDELIELGLESVFKTIYVDRAMPEAIIKVDEMANAVEEYDDMIAKMKEQIELSKQQNEIVQGALLEMAELVYGGVFSEEASESIEGGDVNDGYANGN